MTVNLLLFWPARLPPALSVIMFCFVCKREGRSEKMVSCTKCSTSSAHKTCVDGTSPWTCLRCADDAAHGGGGEPTLRDVMAMIEASTKSHSRVIREVEANLGKSIENCHHEIATALSKIATLEKEVLELRQENVGLKGCVRDLEGRLNTAEQYSRVNDVDVHGIPFVRGENVDTILDSLGRALAFPLNKTNVEVAHRTGPPTAVSRGIIVRFFRKSDKFDFIQARKVKRDLQVGNLDCFGVNNPSARKTIYINESLSSEYRAMLKSAREKKASNILHSVWISGGKLFVKRSESGRGVQILSLSQLSEFCQQ